MHTKTDRLDQTQNALIRRHLAKLCKDISFNRYVTVAFTYSKYGTPLRKHDVSDVKNLVQVYSRKLSWSVYGRERNKSKPRVKMLAWPEYRLRNGDSGHLHYHILVQFPDKHIDYLTRMTLDYWHSMGEKHFGCRPSVDLREAYNPSGAAAYSSKHIESDFTVQSMVVSGLF